MDPNTPFEGRRVSVCRGCGRRIECVNGFCNRCRLLGAGGTGREKNYTDLQTPVEAEAIETERKRQIEVKKRSEEADLSDEEIAAVLQKRTKIMERKKKGEKGFVPESVDANIKE